MTMPSKKSRKIVVDDTEYRWAYSETWEPKSIRKPDDDALSLSLTVETVGEVKARLFDGAIFPASVMAGDCFDSGVVLQPRHVAAFIKQARESGWSPDTDSKNTTVNLLHDIIVGDDQCGGY